MFIDFFNIFSYNNIGAIGELVSLIPIYLLIILSFIKIRKNFGMLTNGLFIFCLVSMPIITNQCLNIRMYTWALFFITASFIYIYEIINKPSYKNWIILTILTICSSYTQYFSLLSSVVLYLTFLIYIFLKNKELLKKWLISTVICIISYIPWLPIVYSQFTTGQNGFWIPKITLTTLVGYVYNILCPIPLYDLKTTMSISSIISTLNSSNNIYIYSRNNNLCNFFNIPIVFNY